MDRWVDAFVTCEAQGWASVPDALDVEAAQGLLLAVAGWPLEALDPEVGPVRQAGASAVCALADRPALLPVAERLAHAAAAAGFRWVPDEAATTRYGPGEGISAHRDNRFYEGFVAVVTLVGAATLRVVADRDGQHELGRWSTAPGHLTLVRGPRAGTEGRPLHEVGPAGATGRQVLTLRRNGRGAGRGWRD